MANATFLCWCAPFSGESTLTVAPKASTVYGPFASRAGMYGTALTPRTSNSVATWPSTWFASGCCGSVIIVPPSRSIPAFSRAIAAIVGPSHSMWSSEMSVTIEISGSTTFVASNRPPIPTSSTAICTLLSAKYRNASAVSISKKLGICGSRPVLTSRSAVSETRKKSRAKSASAISSRPTRIRSFGRSRCGDVYSPVRSPASVKIEASVAAVEPFPFVPAISTAGKRRSGWPSALSRIRTSLSENFRRACPAFAYSSGVIAFNWSIAAA